MRASITYDQCSLVEKAVEAWASKSAWKQSRRHEHQQPILLTLHPYFFLPHMGVMSCAMWTRNMHLHQSEGSPARYQGSTAVEPGCGSGPPCPIGLVR
jgi:hypothetical protein